MTFCFFEALSRRLPLKRETGRTLSCDEVSVQDLQAALSDLAAVLAVLVYLVLMNLGYVTVHQVQILCDSQGKRRPFRNLGNCPKGAPCNDLFLWER